MEDTSYIIRNVEPTDKEKLRDFFIKAYGDKTVFQDFDFLSWYYDTREGPSQFMSGCVVGVSSDGEIISHYGGLYYQLAIRGEIIQLMWGVNAFTLPEWRGKGLNSKIVQYLADTNEANAVIGMPFDAPFFYQKLGYTIFNKDTLDRYIYPLSEETYNVAAAINQDVEQARQLLQIPDETSYSDTNNIIVLTKENIDDYTLNFNVDVVATTARDKHFLQWRFLDNPYIHYDVFGYEEGGEIRAYIAMREEVLQPLGHKIGRIIDIFGNEEYVKYLLDYVVQHARENGYIYLDFSMYGSLYEEVLISSQFVRLTGNLCTLLPQVTSPIQDRPNHEFIVLQSRKYNDVVHSLTRDDVYFTRVDGDRDRLARLPVSNNQSV